MSKSNVYSRLSGLFPTTQKTRNFIKPSKLQPEPATDVPDPTPVNNTNLKIKEMLRENDSEMLVEKFKHLSECSYFREKKPNIYRLAMHRLAKQDQYPLIEKALDSQRSYISDERFASRIIYLYGRYGMFDHAYKVFDELPERNCKQGVRAFNTLLRAAANSGKYEKVYELFRELPEKVSIKPDVQSYNMAMQALCKLNLVEKASSLLDEMKDHLGLKPNVNSFNKLLNVKYGNGELGEGDKLWERMIKSGVVPDINTYNVKLRALVDVGKINEALKFVKQLRSQGLKPDVGTFGAVIQGLIKEDDLVGTKKWYGGLVRSGCVLNKSTYDALVPFLCKKGDYGLAFEVCEEMFKSPYSSIDEAILQNVVDGLANNSMIDKAEVLVELGKSNSYAPLNLVMPNTV